MTTITKIKPEYFPFTQQKTLCVPCSIQWILYRRGFKLVEQEKIAKALKFVGRPKYKNLYVDKLTFSKKQPPSGYGTQATEKLIRAMLVKFKIKLKVKYFTVSKIDEPVKFIKKNIRANNDLLVITNMRPLDPKKKFGHAIVIAALKEGRVNRILIGDPSYNSKRFYWVDLNKIFKGMSNKYDGVERGIYVFSKK